MRMLLGTLLVLLASQTLAQPSEQALRLRDRGIAELENEQPANAAQAFQELIALAPNDPLGYANLAIAALRQQEFDVALEHIGAALKKAPDHPSLLAIEAEIRHWKGEDARALEILRRAAGHAPDDVELQYALYRQAGVVDGESSEAAAGEALERLARLRPENLVVLLQRGIRAREAGDRATATEAFLRIRELAWQAQPAALQMLELVLEALEAGLLEDARLPALRLENVLKISPIYRESLRELSTGIQGIPILRFRDEPEPEAFGDPVEVRLTAVAYPGKTAGAQAVALGDFDGDESIDVATLTSDEAGGGSRIEIRSGGADAVAQTLAAPAATALLVADLDNDGRSDLIAYRPMVSVWRAGDDGRLKDATGDLGLTGVRAGAAEAFDFDIEGDLDLVLVHPESGAVELYRNSLAGPLEAVGENVFADLKLAGTRAIRTTDHDRDGDLDLLFAGEGGLTLLDNLRQGEFVDVTAAKGLGGLGEVSDLASADFDNDGWPDLVLTSKGVRFRRNVGGSYEAWDLGGLKTSVFFRSLATPDLDNDGRLDLAVAGDMGLAVMRQKGGGFEFLDVQDGPAGASSVGAADLDRDGDLDLVTYGSNGLHRLDNQGGNKNRWLAVRLRGLDKGNSKNNLLGRGSTLEVRAGRAYQFREASSDVVHFGLGSQPDAVLRVVWTNGVPQNRIAAKANQRVVEEQVLKGSCPFLYAWDGERIAFVTDLLWGAPAGLPLAPGVWMPADPTEIVEVVGAEPRDGSYDLRVTEELWEAAFIDYVRLWVVDYPEDVEVASSLKIMRGGTPEQVLGTRDVRPLAGARDARGRDVTDIVRTRDEVYADGWIPSSIQGVAREPWTFTLDLGAAPGGPVRLVIDGWIFPTDASLNIALAQRSDLELFPPRLEVETRDGWEVLMPAMPFPPGKTKTMIVDTPRLPEDARRLRIVGSQWLSWDRIAWSTAPADDAPVVVAMLEPAVAELRYRGFSALVRQAPNAPHAYDYARVTEESPWLPFPGGYTRFGDVGELLESSDDRSVVLGPGDEIGLRFDASALPPVAPGWKRTVFLESHGWDKDADKNTGDGMQVEPLPFRAMTSYPYGPDDAFPDTPLHREYLEEWQTRVVDYLPAAGEPSGK